MKHRLRVQNSANAWFVTWIIKRISVDAVKMGLIKKENNPQPHVFSLLYSRSNPDN
jgi:hypothetical protein